jgi:hypothetical protein
MTYQIGTQWQTLQPDLDGTRAAEGQAVRAVHAQRLVEDLHLLRASRLRALWSDGQERTTTSTTLSTIYEEQEIRLSRTSSAQVLLAIIGERTEVTVTITDGTSSTTGTATQSGAGTSLALSSPITASPVASDTPLRIKLQWRATSGTGTLQAVRLYEADMTAATLA